MKKLFEMPEIEMNRFSVEEVITLSGDPDTGEGGLPEVNPFSSVDAVVKGN